jgi:hypothetical protein
MSGPAAVARLSSARGAWLLVAVLVPILLLTSKREVTKAGNETSRLAVVESLVDHGTFVIDGSRFSTFDKVKIRGRFYSDKPLLLSVGLAGVYWLLCHLSGLGFEHSYGATLQLLTFLGIGGFSLLLALLCYGRLRQAGASPALSWLASAAAVLSTWVLSYGTTINNHTPAAAVLFALEWTLEGALSTSEEPHARISRFCAAGALAGVLFDFELATGAIFFAAGLATIAATRPGTKAPVIAYVAGFTGPLLLMLLLELIAHGSIIPAYLAAGGQSFRGNIHSDSVAGLRQPGNALWYLFEITLGHRGIISYMPALIFALPALGPRTTGPSRMHWSWTSAFLIVILFYATRTGDFGGWAYGFRFLIPVLPLLLYRAVLWLLVHRTGRLELAFAAALCVGLLTSVVGAYNPWPVVYEGASTAEGAVEDDIRNPFFANLLCMSFELAPKSALTAALIDRIYGAKRSRKYLLLAYDSVRRPDLIERVRQTLPR